ncbi:Hypothetical protein CpCap5W_2199 [Corynebacterium pseudotuberculosis]|nr:hypothetical protein CPTA_00498 [Corynebacterium pseudotuberculosis]AIG09090.1 hypothetical protein CPTB_01034 [Corynebacterium pseudotuberculosis]AIG10989.1 hypothetical protein CPTC_00701 [Corynebacterium pseudotuberculosis]AKC74862.1 Hypothetical protein Cp226_2181 [Corynebacterium pseudotuberculosis]ALM78662.1 Hypothetical protein Cp1002B_2150 [Corynebacterium pseudotuberculosis]
MLSISLARTMRAVFLFGYLPGHEPAINHIPIAQRKSHVLLLYQRLFLTTGSGQQSIEFPVPISITPKRKKAMVRFHVKR